MASLDPVFAAYVFLHFLTLAVTSVRLGWRVKTKKQWWDDAWMLLGFLFTAIIISNYLALGLRSRNTYPPTTISWFTWTSYLASPTAMWAGRISLLLTIVNVLPVGSFQRKTTQVAFVVFALMWAALILAKVFMCGVPVPRNLDCPIPRKTTAVTLTFNLVGAVWLTGWSGFLFLQKKHITGLRNLFITAGVVGLALIALDIAHAVNVIRSEKTGTIAIYVALNTSGNLQVIVSLLGANAAAIITQFFPIAPPMAQASSDTDSVSTTEKKKNLEA